MPETGLRYVLIEVIQVYLYLFLIMTRLLLIHWFIPYSPIIVNYYLGNLQNIIIFNFHCLCNIYCFLVRVINFTYLWLPDLNISININFTLHSTTFPSPVYGPLYIHFYIHSFIPSQILHKHIINYYSLPPLYSSSITPSYAFLSGWSLFYDLVIFFSQSLTNFFSSQCCSLSTHLWDQVSPSIHVLSLSLNLYLLIIILYPPYLLASSSYLTPLPLI